MHALLLAFSLLAPAPPTSLPAEPVNPRTQSLSYPVTWKSIGPDGKVWIFSGVTTGTLTIEDPPPPPVNPTITALRNEQGQGVEQIRSGDVLVIEGVKLWQEGVSIRAQIPGRTATVLSFSPERLRVRFPLVSAPMEGPLLIYHNSGSGWTLITTGPRITILPSLAPGVPKVRSYHGPSGEPKRLFRVGEPITIRGEGFGDVPGEVMVGRRPSPVLAWRDGEITISGYPRTTHGQPAWETLWLEVWRADGVAEMSFSRETDPVVVP